MTIDAIHCNSNEATRSTPTISQLTRAKRASPALLTKWLNGLARLVFGRLLPRLPYLVLRGPLQGCWYILGATAGEAGGVSVHLGLQEVEQSRCLAELLQPNDVFFDVGANVGFYSLLGARTVGKQGAVIAFEPAPRNLAFLFRHVRMNRFSNVIILPVACAERISVQAFVEGDNPAVGHLEEANGHESNPTPAKMKTVVATVPLDVASQRLGVDPNIIKIDVEGAELQVLKGATDILTRVRPIILLSVHSEILREMCIAHLQDFGYAVHALNADSIEHATEYLAKPAAVS